jgi:hypothetical protein
MDVPMTLTAHQWATAVRPLLDHGIIEVPGWYKRGDDWRRMDLAMMGSVRFPEDATDYDRLAFLAVIDGVLLDAGWSREKEPDGWFCCENPPTVSVVEHVQDPDRETAALRAAYAQWPELGELKL